MSGGPLAGLDGLRVLDLSDDVAGAYCTKLLADAGAQVTRAERTEGHRLRGWSISGSCGRDGEEDGVLFRFLAAGQESIELGTDPAPATIEALAAEADVAVVSTVGGRMPTAPAWVDPMHLHQAHGALVVVSLSDFGLTGPRAGDRSPEFLLQALGGSLHNHGSTERVPLAVGGGLAEWTVGTYGALGTLTALTGRRRSGVGDLVDVSALECLAVTFICYPSVQASMPGGERRRSTYVMIPGIERCSDGYVGLATITTAQWHTFLDMIERPDLAEDTTLYNQHERRRPDVLQAIDDWTSRHTVDEVIEIGSLYRIPTVPLGNGEIFPRLEHVRAREVYDVNPRGGFPHPRPPFRSSATERRLPQAAPARRDRRPFEDLASTAPSWRAARPFWPDIEPAERPSGLPLEGIRILDITAFLAGPMSTQYLASIGADVIKVESIQRPDPMRFAVLVEPTVDRWYEQSTIFHSCNLNKRGLTLNLSDPRGQELARRLVAEADVVVENFTPRVMEHFGLTYEALRAINPGIIMVRMPGFGLAGPWRERPGFAASMEQVSGLAWVTGYTDGQPIIPGICDPLAGMHSAFAILTALEHRARTGEGQEIELAMIDMTASLVSEQVLEHAVYGHLMQREGNRLPGLAHQGVYPCSDPEQWVAVSMATDEDWQALRTALGAPAWASDPRLQSQQGRLECSDLLDERLGAWCAAHSHKDALAALRAAGVPSEVVVHSYDVDLDDQMNSRGFWEEVSHDVVGTVRFPAWPIRIHSRHQPWFRLAAPLLGADNAEILGAVGVSEAELDKLARDGIVGTRPAAL
jgi:crotonobetainyl-CoA:carnitine CoA-transferase CaiB-like acyl-CoA transferase